MLDSLKAMPTKGKLTLAGAALGVLLVAVVLMKVATQPSYTTLVAAVDPAQTSKLTAALDSAGITYKLENNGTALSVQSSQVAQARVTLASQGLGNGQAQQPGYSQLLNKQSLGQSTFQQQVTYQRALEGEIAQTIDGISGVGGARVQLTLPQDQLFSSDSKPATASVLLGGSSTSIDPGQVRGIASLVANAVEGLKTSNVTITDGAGQLLWPQQGSGTNGATTKTDAQARYAAQLQSQVMSMLDRTLGPGKAEVTIQPDLNVDKTTLDKLTYAKKGVPLTQTTETERLTGTGGSGGTAGATGNITAGTTGSSTGNSNYNKRSSTTNYGVDKTVQRSEVAPGTVNRLTVGLILDKSVPKAQVASLKAAVASAVGLQASRGDTLSVAQVPFAKTTTAAAPKAGPIPTQYLGYAKYAGLGFALMLFLFFIRRGLRRRESDALGPEPTWLREIEISRPVAELAAPVPEAPTLRSPVPPATQRAVERLVEQEPDKVAQQLRNWMQEDD